MSLYDTQKEPYSQDIVVAWKHAGETLAVLVERFRLEQGIAPDVKLTYAGRLDPMAEGVVLLLKGDARFDKETFLNLEKTYECTVLLGVSTDTADMLGLVTATGAYDTSILGRVEKAVQTLESVTELSYPLYSSKTVAGVPLFVHARAGTVVDVPTKKVVIRHTELISLEERTLAACIDETIPIIKSVQGDFRQEEIIAGLERLRESAGDQTVALVVFRATVTSGTYLRALAEHIGATLGVPALAYRIKRTKIGEYTYT